MHQGIDQDKANWLTIDLIVYLLKTLGLGVGAVAPHKKWTGKNCPRLILPWWDSFIMSIESKLSLSSWNPKKELALLQERRLIFEVKDPNQSVNWGEFAAVMNRHIDQMHGSGVMPMVK